MKISIGADHRGYRLKAAIINHFSEHTWLDVGTDSAERTDYPIFAKKACDAIAQGTAEVGVLLCGSGIGVSIAANRFAGIYAGLCWNEELARLAKEHDGINVLVLPADFVADDQAFAMIAAWLSATFKGGVYQTRLDQIEEFSAKKA